MNSAQHSHRMYKSVRVEAFDQWIRTSFVEMNTALEDMYYAQDDRAHVEGVGDAIKAQLRDEGRDYVAALLHEGNTGDGFESGFGVLGNVGLYMGALRRHELSNPDKEERSPFAEASSLVAPCRRLARHGAALRHRASRHPQSGAGRRAQKLHLASRRVPVHR